MSSISFDNPYLLLLIIPIAALFVVPYAVVIRRENLSGHNVASMVMHVVMAVIIGFAAAGTSLITTVTETDVYVLADVSYSASRNLDAVDGYITKLKSNLPDNSRMGVICFGNNYRLTTRLGAAINSVKNSLPENGGTVDDSGTDIISVLSYAGTLFRENAVKRIVLITDGRQTTGETTADLKAQIDSLGARKIHVDAIFLDSNLKPGESEAQVCSVNYTQSVYVGSEQRAQLEFRCNFAENSGIAESGVQAKIKTVAKVKNPLGELVETVNYDDAFISLARGYTAYKLKLLTDVEGSVDYTVTLETTDANFTDGNLFNNKLQFTQFTGKVGKTLFLTQREEDYAAVKDLVEGGELDYYINTSSVPSSVEELCEYDRIILSDINLDYLDNSELFIESLNTVVSSFGKNLMTFGDVSVQSDDDGSLKALGDMLPVKFDASDGGRLFALVVDASYSMFMANRLDFAKSVAKAFVNILKDEDDVILIKYDGDVEILENGINLGTGENRETLLREIDNITTEHGTNTGAAIEAAAKNMSSSDYSDKRLMLISDGVNYQGETNDSLSKKINELRRNYVYTTTFGVGSEAQCPTGVSFLKNVANLGGGTFYDVSSFEKAEDVINFDLSREQAPEEGGRSYVTVKRSRDDLLNGVKADVENTYVNSFIAGKIRSSATTVMTVKTKKGGDAPLYAYWDYGEGRVSTFASGISGDSIKPWLSGKMKEELFMPMFGNMFESARPDERINHPFTVDVTDNGGYATVEITPYEIHTDDSVTVKVVNDRGEERALNAAFANSAYYARFNIPDTGEYWVEVSYTSGENTFVAQKALAVAYTAEYDSFAMYDEGVLQNAIGANGSVVADGSLKLENDKSEIGVYRYPLAVPLLAVCVALYAADIAVRKLKKEDLISLFKGVKK